MSSNKTSQNTLPEAKEKQKRKVFLRLVVSIIAFIFLIKYGNVDLKAAFNHLLTVNPLFYTIAYFFYLVTLFSTGFRFYIASSALGFHKNYLQCVQLNFVGTLFNNFLPTTFGGDALRGYYLRRGTHHSITKAVACLVCERYAGMVVLFWLATIAFLLQDLGFISKEAWSVRRAFVWFSYLGTFASFFIVPFLPNINRKLFGKSNLIHKKFIEPVIVYWNDMGLVIKIFFLSVILQISVLLCHIFIGLSLNIDIPLSYYLVFYPLVTIAGFLIPSLNGLGIREGAYIYFLSLVGINGDAGLAFGLGWLVILFITSILGGFVYMFGDFRRNIPLEELNKFQA